MCQLLYAVLLPLCLRALDTAGTAMAEAAASSPQASLCKRIRCQQRAPPVKEWAGQYCVLLTAAATMGHLQAMVSIAGLTEEVVAELCERAKQAAPGEGEVCQIAKPVCNLSACRMPWSNTERKRPRLLNSGMSCSRRALLVLEQDQPWKD